MMPEIVICHLSALLGGGNWVLVAQQPVAHVVARERVRQR